MLRPEFQKAIRNHQYERQESGLFLPRQGVVIGGVFTHDVRRAGEWLGEETDHNVMTTEGLTHLLDVLLHDGVKTATWYVALFKGSSYTPVATLTAATFDAAATELVEYDNTASHPEFAEAAPAGTPSPSVSNAASKAQFVISATVTACGAALVSTPTRPTPNSGNLLLCASKFASARALVDNDELYITYTLTASDA